MSDWCTIEVMEWMCELVGVGYKMMLFQRINDTLLIWCSVISWAFETIFSVKVAPKLTRRRRYLSKKLILTKGILGSKNDNLGHTFHSTNRFCRSVKRRGVGGIKNSACVGGIEPVSPAWQALGHWSRGCARRGHWS